MVDFLDRDRRSNSVLPLQFGQGIKPPCWPNFAQNMHPIKQCRRSLARPDRTTLEYHGVDNGVALGWPRRFCVIASIAFVGGMGGWCCWTWCAVVFAVVLRSCGIFLYNVLLPGRGAGGQLTNKINTSGVGRERSVSQLKKLLWNGNLSIRNNSTG
jgi:hypothetical protein